MQKIFHRNLAAQLGRIGQYCREIYLLELGGATAVSSLGAAANQFNRMVLVRSLPLWFAAYLLVYNLDRLFLDPADQMNLPLRTRKYQELLPRRRLIALVSALLLAAWPLLVGRWLIWPTTVAAIVALSYYSRTFPGTRWRLKDLPLAKCVLVPGAIALFLVGWPAWDLHRHWTLQTTLALTWSYSLLLLNSVAGDLRDVRGDGLTGTRTLVAKLGPGASRGWLLVLGLINLLLTHFLFPKSAGVLLSLLAGEGLVLGASFFPGQPWLLTVAADLYLLLPLASLIPW